MLKEFSIVASFIVGLLTLFIVESNPAFSKAFALDNFHVLSLLIILSFIGLQIALANTVNKAFYDQQIKASQWAILAFLPFLLAAELVESPVFGKEVSEGAGSINNQSTIKLADKVLDGVVAVNLNQKDGKSEHLVLTMANPVTESETSAIETQIDSYFTDWSENTKNASLHGVEFLDDGKTINISLLWKKRHLISLYQFIIVLCSVPIMVLLWKSRKSESIGLVLGISFFAQVIVSSIFGNSTALGHITVSILLILSICLSVSAYRKRLISLLLKRQP